MSLYTYRAQIIRVIDGDTVHAMVDLGCDVHINMTLRLAGINAPELPAVVGIEAKEFLENMLPTYAKLLIRTEKDHKEKYGRYLAWIFNPAYGWLNRIMVDKGHAVIYGPSSVDPPEETPGV